MRTKMKTSLLFTIVTFSNCSKNDGFDSDVLATIQSSYVWEALREKNKASKKDVKSLTALELTFNIG